MKLSKADAKTLVELLIKAGKDIEYSVRTKHIAASDTAGDTICFDIQHLNDKDFDEVCKYIDEFNSTDINSALSDLKSALKDGIDKLEEYDNRKQLEDMQEKTRLIDANAFIRSLANYEGKPFTPGLCATLVELFPATCDTEAYLKGRADKKHEDLAEQAILTKHEIKVLETSLIKKILTAIESEYDLNYGEILLNPRDFYDLVEGYLPSDSEC